MIWIKRKFQNSTFYNLWENASLYTKRQFERAKEARKFYNIIRNPSLNDFKAIIKMNGIKNCPVTLGDIDIAEKNFG